MAATKPVFLHVPRTGGTSICRALVGQIDHSNHSPLETARKLRPEWDTTFKFGFVRNPWDRAFSYYCHAMGECLGAKDFQTWIRSQPDQLTKKTAAQILVNPDGTPGVDFIGQFEHIGHDYHTVLELAGLKYVCLQFSN